MIDAAFPMSEDEEAEEEEADAEIDKILFELTNGKLGKAGTVETAPPVSRFSKPGLCRTMPSTRITLCSHWRPKKGSLSWS